MTRSNFTFSLCLFFWLLRDLDAAGRTIPNQGSNPGAYTGSGRTSATESPQKSFAFFSVVIKTFLTQILHYISTGQQGLSTEPGTVCRRTSPGDTTLTPCTSGQSQVLHSYLIHIHSAWPWARCRKYKG